MIAALTIKTGIAGVTIYTALAAAAVSFLLLLCERKRAGEVCMAAGSLLALALVIARAVATGQAPMHSMFEVFLVLAAAIWPLSLFWRRVLKVGGHAVDPLLLAILLFPAGFAFPSVAMHRPPVLQSPLFLPHVLAYLLGYVVMAKAGVEAMAALTAPRERAGQGDAPAAAPDDPAIGLMRDVHRLVLLGLPLITVGLVLGAVWGKLAWGNWWNWDPKELWSLATWLVYVIYLHARAAWGRRWPRGQAAMVVLGLVFVVVTLLWVNLSPALTGRHSYAG